MSLNTSSNGNSGPLTFFLGWILFITTESEAKLLVLIGVLDCRCPIYISVIICDTDLQAFTYIAPISGSGANVLNTLIIWEIFNTAPLFIRVLSLSDKKKCPPTQILDLGLLR